MDYIEYTEEDLLSIKFAEQIDEKARRENKSVREVLHEIFDSKNIDDASQRYADGKHYLLRNKWRQR